MEPPPQPPPLLQLASRAALLLHLYSLLLVWFCCRAQTLPVLPQQLPFFQHLLHLHCLTHRAAVASAGRVFPLLSPDTISSLHLLHQLSICQWDPQDLVHKARFRLLFHFPAVLRRAAWAALLHFLRLLLPVNRHLCPRLLRSCSIHPRFQIPALSALLLSFRFSPPSL